MKKKNKKEIKVKYPQVGSFGKGAIGKNHQPQKKIKETKSQETETTFEGYGECNAKTSTMLPITNPPNPQENWEELIGAIIKARNMPYKKKAKIVADFIDRAFGFDQKSLKEKYKK